MITNQEIRERLDLDHIEECARYCRRQVDQYNVGGVKVTPGDGTLYQIIVSRPWLDAVGNRSGEYNVNLIGLGASYPWNGWSVDETYVQEKWVPNSNRWTTVVMTLFLDAYAKAGALT
jgi:hypothetical protein